MRLDKFLKVSRLIKRRTVANEACDAGRVLVNGKSAKASLNVKEGDVIEIEFGTRTVKVEVLDVQETVRKDEAKELSQAPGEVYAAISMALHEMQDEVHDVEETVLTITRVKRSYSPWSSKIYTLRENPNRK